MLLAARFIPVFGIGRGILYGFFHSISAFCNAGFDLMGGYSGEYSSFVEFYGDILINLVLMALVILGGIGFCMERCKAEQIPFQKIYAAYENHAGGNGCASGRRDGFILSV